MAGEWRVATFKEAPLQIIDGDRGKNYPNQAEFAPTGQCLFLNAGNVTTNGFRFTDRAFITAEQDALLRKGKLVRHDVVLTTRGTVGNAAYFDDSVPFDHIRINSGMVILRAETTALDPRYLYLFVRSSLFHEQVSVLRTGSAQPQLPIQDINRVEIPIPPLTEQRAIAQILGTLDDKIELNRRMNETLEAMARALFKSWFVDFGPVRAKAEGRDPGLPQPIADLFPARLVDSELGEIPEGWEVQRVGDIGTIVCGKTPHTQVSEYYGYDLPFITIPDMHGRIFATSVQRRLSRAGAQSQEKKMLPVGAICVSCIGTAGLVVITSELSQTNQQINSVVPNQKNATYFWYWTLRNLGDDIRAGGSGGSVLTNLSTGRFAELRLLASVAKLRSCYHMMVAPLFRRILENEHESSSLATLRDTLLPKLISGELRVGVKQEFHRLLDQASRLM